jgi:G:T/U-mismatch repair DNA glycosylase
MKTNIIKFLESDTGTMVKRKRPTESLTVQSPPMTLPIASPSPSTWVSSIHSGGGNRVGSFAACVDEIVDPHTLILGTQPSVRSLNNGWYFGSDANAFWHIVGDALGFRRGFHCNTRPNGDVVPSIAQHLLHTEAIQYNEAMRRLNGAGYALWDILESSERKGSLDSAIKNPTPAPIEAFVERYKSVQRICFATGKGSAISFRKHFADWLQRGRFRVAPDAASVEVFGTGTKAVPNVADGIELCVMHSVSPACAGIAYPVKRQQWFDRCFTAEQGTQ